MADDNNNEKQEKQVNRPENDTSTTSYINQLRSSDTIEDALAAHVSLWQEVRYQQDQQESSDATSPSVVSQQSSNKDSPKSKK